jgi:hypothetical protein
MKKLAMIPAKPIRIKSLPFPESLRILLIKRSQRSTDYNIEPTKAMTPIPPIDESYGK